MSLSGLKAIGEDTRRELNGQAYYYLLISVTEYACASLISAQ